VVVGELEIDRRSWWSKQTAAAVHVYLHRQEKSVAAETGNRLHLTYILPQKHTRNLLTVVTGHPPQTTTSFLTLCLLPRNERLLTLHSGRHKPVVIPVPGKNGQSAHVAGRSKRKGWYESHITMQCNSVLGCAEKVGTGCRRLGCRAPEACLNLWAGVWLKTFSDDEMNSLERGSTCRVPCLRVANRWERQLSRARFRIKVAMMSQSTDGLEVWLAKWRITTIDTTLITMLELRRKITYYVRSTASTPLMCSTLGSTEALRCTMIFTDTRKLPKRTHTLCCVKSGLQYRRGCTL
jgi:hypothetical protein